MDSSRALSPVVGTVLIVAIVVTLSAVAGTMALSMTEEREPAPEVTLEAESSENGFTHHLVHRHGEELDGDKLTLRGAADPDVLEGTELSAGERVEFLPLESELDLIWAGEHGATYSLTAIEVERALPATPDEGCSWVSTNTNSGTESVDVDGIVVNCDVQTDKDIEIYNSGIVIGDVTSDTKDVDMDDGKVYGDVEVATQLNIQDGQITGSVTAHTENVKIDTSTVGGSVTAESKEIEVIDGSSVDGDLVVEAQDLIKIQSSSVSGSVTTDGQVDVDDATVTGDVTSGVKPLTVSAGSSVNGDLKSDDVINVQSSSVSGSVVTGDDVDLDGATIDGEVYVGGTFSCDDSTINGQDCGSYTPQDPGDW